ncbi:MULTISPECIES: ABC transporter ATP-binding protein [Geobacillus]|jgi:ATP-binding cassette, subfamily B, putative efflux pump|uniref:ABC transporter ATP-binding protein n=1 Tax=Geobacillus TaxID=129337 RepID=UPI0006E4FBDD|nr:MULTISPECIES: ABC transporter ATP-binding protein [Geobacillus]ATO37042.1 multidrug ABC transporter ATP-binding protein [Geobacillus thermodenitrificans]KQB94554.1 putative multidrug export ATP-binding/permease protein YgaD [Geobacillus sp. PA-3]MED0664239.1 ABC transporter ATP-binding protein [Geobacillus thermodenitrificans]MED3718249.1 ABC transporter ATP-binding protein [Geobacillus thermodenitrificans]MED3906586.1 ABC transporter ATP-binding protein [Geobacillus thermodenitrificans]
MGSIRRYWQFVRPYRWHIAATMVIGIIKFSIPLLIPLLLKFVVDDVIANHALSLEEKTNRLWQALAFMLIVFLVIRPFVEYYRQYFAQWTASKVLYDIRQQLFHHMQKLSVSYYANHRTGEVISRVINDVEQTKEFIITGLMNLWIDMATILIALVIMVNMDVKMTLISVSTLPLYAFAVKYFFGRLRQRTRQRSQALAELQAYLHERVQGMPVVKSFAIEDEEQRRFSKQNGHFLTKALIHTSWNAKSFAAVNTITDIAPIVVIIYAGYEVITGQMTVGTMVAFVGYIERLYTPLRRLVNASTTLTQSFASMDRVFEFLDERYDIDDAPQAIECRCVKGDIVFDRVTFAYHDGGPLVLRDVSFSVKAGETVALVGPSGGGKSTLVSLIPRFYDVTDGRILLDGMDIRSFRVRSLRDQIGLVFQDNFLFSDSVKENILLGKPDATDEEVIAAAKAANAHEFIMSLPDGYDTRVGERGVKLSGGQKQRIAIARVFLKNPPIFIFDEATSALDLENEQYIQEALDRLAKNRTTFVVAHRLSTITHADRILFIENGQIVESGTHEELMAKRGSYYELFMVQHL